MPYQPETSYFVRLDAPPTDSRNIPLERERHWEDPSAHPASRFAAPPRRRRRRFHIRPVGLLLGLLLGWVGWAYTTPGGPSARISEWIDHTRGDVANVGANPGLHRTAAYFDQLYATQGRYPNLSDTTIQEEPSAGFGLGMTFTWCNGRAVVLGSLSSGGTVSRLLLDGRDLGDVGGTRSCPANLAKPAPWKIARKTS